MKAIFENIEYVISDSNLHVFNSYLITCDETKVAFLNYCLQTYETFARMRKLKSLLKEWKAHNICYQHGWWVDRTRDADFEFKQPFFHKIAFWFICLLFKEKDSANVNVGGEGDNA